MLSPCIRSMYLPVTKFAQVCIPNIDIEKARPPSLSLILGEGESIWNSCSAYPQDNWQSQRLTDLALAEAEAK